MRNGKTAARVYGQASRQAAEALALERAGDMDAAIDVWHPLFGDSFPPAPHRSVQNALTALAAGSVTSTGRPSTTKAAQQVSAPGRSWSPGPKTDATPTTGPATELGNPGE